MPSCMHGPAWLARLQCVTHLLNIVKCLHCQILLAPYAQADPNSRRRLLATTAAEVYVELDTASNGAVPGVQTDLTNVISNGKLSVRSSFTLVHQRLPCMHMLPAYPGRDTDRRQHSKPPPQHALVATCDSQTMGVTGCANSPRATCDGHQAGVLDGSPAFQCRLPDLPVRLSVGHLHQCVPALRTWS